VVAVVVKRFGPGGLAVVAGLLIGWTIVNAPVLTWIVLGGGAGLLMVQLPACTWVGMAVLSATLSRLVVAVEIAPPIINFVHFPLTLGAVFIAAAGGAQRRTVARSIAVSATALLILSLLSWMFNDGEPLRPILNWLVFIEPFFIIYALTGSPLKANQRARLWVLALIIPFLQLPLCTWQKLTVGSIDPDLVQGTFIGVGAGHHVAGGVALLGLLICTARGLSTIALAQRLVWLIAGTLLFAIPVFADAKQNIAAFLPALGLLLLAFHARWAALIAATPLIALTLFIAFTSYDALYGITSSSSMQQGFQAKIRGLRIVAERLSETPAGWPFGLGPGNSVSRVALMGMERYLNADSPVAILGLGLAPTTQQIWQMGAEVNESWMFSGSSVWTGISSWTALLGDLGLIGIGLYLWMSWMLWHHLKTSRHWQMAAAKSVLLMTSLLGIFYSWLEEPTFTLLAALVVGLGLTVTSEANS
jgi:hypothetical protein